MKLLDETKYDFSDVLLLPKRTEYSSRSEVCLERSFRFKYSPHVWTGIPIIVSNMDTTGTIEMAKSLQNYKVLTCLHKYYTVGQIQTAVDSGLSIDFFAVTSGIQPADLENLDSIIRAIGPKFVCLDVANGYMSRFIETCAEVRAKYPELVIIAGNVCTSEGVQALVVDGKVDIVKIGLGNGSCCTTRKQTGIGMPQFSAVMECSDTAHGMDAHIISDGGIQVIGDFAKAFGAGADFVMSGSMFAGHEESGGDKVEERDSNGKTSVYKIFYGMSSETAMNKYHGGVAKYRASEGKTVKVAYKGEVANTILEIMGGIRSSMTYIGAKKIKDIGKCATFVRVNRQLNNLFG